MPLSVLLVDDNAADAELLERALRRDVPDVDVEWVTSLEAASGALKRDPLPNVIISDHNLDGFTGSDVLKAVTELAPEVPFILVTGALDEETAVGYMKAGASDYMLKDRLVRLGAAVTAAVAEAAQKRSLARERVLLRAVLDAAPTLIFVKDSDGRFVLANQAVAAVYGTSVDGLVGKTDADFADDAEADAFRQDDRNVLASGQPKVIPEERITVVGTGEERWLRTVKIPLWLPGAKQPLLLGVAADITENLRLDAQLRQAQKMEAIGRLAGGVAHDFNNLLTAMMGTSELLLVDLAEEDPRREDVLEIKELSVRAADLTRQLLAFSRKQPLRPAVVNLNTIVVGLEKILRRTLGEDVDLVLFLNESLGAAKVDPGQVEQIIMNLAVNARDAMPTGGKLTIETANITLDGEYTRKRKPVVPGPHVMIAVSDDGDGMDAETQEHLFEPFFTTKDPGKGTGLGLSTVYGIVKQSGGYIWVYSEPGAGAVFKVYFPRVDEAVATSREAYVPADLTGTETVLVAEDEVAVRAIASRVLTGLGYVVLEAENGADALALATRYDGTIDLLLTDVVMPEFSGKELARRIREGRPHLPVLYMSGYTDNAIVHHGVLEEGVEFLQKPFQPEALGRRVRELLDREME